MGVAVGDYNTTASPIFSLPVSARADCSDTGKEHLFDVTKTSGLGGHIGLSTSALWFDSTAMACSICSCATMEWFPITMYFAVSTVNTSPLHD